MAIFQEMCVYESLWKNLQLLKPVMQLWIKSYLHVSEFIFCHNFSYGGFFYRWTIK